MLAGAEQNTGRGELAAGKIRAERNQIFKVAQLADVWNQEENVCFNKEIEQKTLGEELGSGPGLWTSSSTVLTSLI